MEKLERLLAVSREKLNFILAVFIVFVLIAGAVAYSRHARIERQKTSALFLEQGKFYLRGEDPDKAGEYFHRVISEYPRTPAAEEAELYLARAHIEKGERFEAGQILENFLKTHPESDLIPEVYLELGFIAESEENFEEAAGFYTALYENFPRHFLAPQAMLDTARCFIELGKWDDARRVCEALISEYPWSGASETAREYLDIVLREIELSR